MNNNQRMKVDGNHIYIRNNRLRVEISRTGSSYRGSRFDWTGFITQVTLDEKHTFCVPESIIPGRGTGGEGLCNEFGIFAPLGYDECQPGEQFAKIGVGLLTRMDEANYSFARPYEVMPFEIGVYAAEHGETVDFLVEPALCNGYAVKLNKTVSIKDNCLEIRYLLHNVGEKEIKTQEYCHNFISINNHHIGPDYRLEAPVKQSAGGGRNLEGILEFSDGSVRWVSEPQNEYFCSFELPEGCTDGFSWVILHQGDQVGISETCDFSPDMLCMWGTSHVVSPEVFAKIEVKPGEKKTWTRIYRFFTW